MPFYCNLIFCIAGLLWSLYRTLVRGNLVSLPVVVWGSTFAFLFVEPLVNGGSRLDEVGFNLVITSGLVGLLIATIITSPDAVDGPGSRTRFLPNWLITGGTLVYLSILVWHGGTAIAHGALTDLVTKSRVQEYLSEHYAEGASVGELSDNYLQFFFWIYLAGLWRRRKRARFLLLTALPLIDHLATAGTRFDFTANVIATGSFVLGFRTDKQYAAGRSSRIKLGLIGLTVCACFAVFYGIVGNALRNGTFQNGVAGVVSDTTELGADVVLRDLTYYDYVHELHDSLETSKIDFDNGAALYYDALALLPRTLWDEKPYTATSVRLTELLVGKVGTGLPIYTYTIYGEGYWEGGYLGAFLEPIIFVVIYTVLFLMLGAIRDTRMARLMVCFHAIPHIRAEVAVTLYLTEFLFVLFLLLLSKPVDDAAPSTTRDLTHARLLPTSS